MTWTTSIVTKAPLKVAKMMLKATINGRSVEVPPGSTILQACKAVGVHLPTLCYHPSFEPTSATCRLCLVEVGGTQPPEVAKGTLGRREARLSPKDFKLLPACFTKVTDGMVITTDSEKLHDFRKRDIQFLLAKHPNDCMRCEASGRCKLQNLVSEYKVVEYWPKKERVNSEFPDHILHDHTSPAIYRDMSKCIECELCVKACAAQQINALGMFGRSGERLPVTLFEKPLSETNCISCGQCTLRCPVGALVERPDWHRVLEVLDARRRISVVQTAPATRVAIGEEFGFEPGTVSTGRLVNALRALGFDYVFDTNFTADLTIMEEANELLARVRGERPDGKLPLLTSCCPGWINYIEIHRPDLIPHLSTTKSPQQMHGATTKYGPFAKTLPEEPYVVSIMPCTAKKEEAVRPGQRGDVDAVLTTRELAKLIKHRNIPFASLPNDGKFDSPLGESTGAAVIFGASGGVLEAALRTAADVLGIPNAPINWESVRGVDAPIKEATVPGVGKVAAVNSIGAAIDLLRNDEWKKKYLMIEVMTCKGGCLGGGGEPKSDDPEILQKRAKGIYSIDEKMVVRKSHENKEVQELYDTFLGHPLSETSEKYLHATFAERRSPREKLMRFLDAVDHRDGMVASNLFTEDGEWHTNTDTFGIIRGRDAIKQFIETRLPPLPSIFPSGVERPRHKMLDHANGTEVKTPLGEIVHFDVELDPKTSLIKSLTRIPLIPREKLIQFLDAVDQRDGMRAANLFIEGGEWHTNTEVFGDINGRDAICEFIRTRLPPLPTTIPPGSDPPRHKMVDDAKGTDVKTPMGDTVHFDIELEPTTGLIKNLTRKALSKSS